MPVDDEILKLVVRQLQEALATNQTIVSSLQQEMMQNREVRAVFRANLDSMHAAVESLQRVVDGTDSRDSLAVVLVKFQAQIDDLKERLDEVDESMRAEAAKKAEAQKTWQERFWQLLLQNSPGMLTALGVAAYTILRQYFSS